MAVDQTISGSSPLANVWAVWPQGSQRAIKSQREPKRLRSKARCWRKMLLKVLKLTNLTNSRQTPGADRQERMWMKLSIVTIDYKGSTTFDIKPIIPEVISPACFVQTNTSTMNHNYPTILRGPSKYSKSSSKSHPWGHRNKEYSWTFWKVWVLLHLLCLTQHHTNSQPWRW